MNKLFKVRRRTLTTTCLFLTLFNREFQKKCLIIKRTIIKTNATSATPGQMDDFMIRYVSLLTARKRQTRKHFATEWCYIPSNVIYPSKLWKRLVVRFRTSKPTHDSRLLSQAYSPTIVKSAFFNTRTRFTRTQKLIHGC